MNDGKKSNLSRVITKALVICSILFVSALGIHYRPRPTYDYSSVSAFETDNGALKIDFDFLGGFDYEKDGMIPEAVKGLDGKTVKITGFMLPVDFESDTVSRFMLMNFRVGCCFDVMPRVNEFVYVEMPEGISTKYLTDIPLAVTGRLGVAQGNIVGGIYTMTADSVETVTD